MSRTEMQQQYQRDAEHLLSGALAIPETCSLDLLVGDGTDFLGDLVARVEPTQERAAMRREVLAALDAELATMAPRRAAAMRARLLGDITLEESGAAFGVS